MLEDFPDETPGPAADQEGWACPVSLGPALEDASVESDPLAALRQEIDRLRPWYELTVEKRGRTTVGISEVEIDDLAEYLVAFIGDADTAPPRTDIPRPHILKLAADDLKAYYFEAATAQPGDATDKILADWYYGETTISTVLRAVNETCRNSGDEALIMMSDRRIFPIHQQHNKLMACKQGGERPKQESSWSI